MRLIEKACKYAIIALTELPGANNTGDLAERGAWLFYLCGALGEVFSSLVRAMQIHLARFYRA